MMGQKGGDVRVQFVVTPWRDAEELFQVRQDLYDVHDPRKRQRGVNKVLAWRTRKCELPLLLDCTADIVGAVLSEESEELDHNALRLVYGTAVARFVTGFTDTQLDLRRSKPSFLNPDQSTPPSHILPFPPHLLETRHSIVHRALPSLSDLKSAAQASLSWLWEHYWSLLDAALANSHPTRNLPNPSLLSNDSKTSIQALLKTYLKSRKSEIKNTPHSKKKDSPSSSSPTAEKALSSLLSLLALDPAYQPALLSILVTERFLLPADRKLGASMSGAFLIWTPLLSLLCTSLPRFRAQFSELLLAALSDSAGGAGESEATKEAWLEWLVRLHAASSFFAGAAGRDERRRASEEVLERCFVEAGEWYLRLAGRILEACDVGAKEEWRFVLEAARAGNGDVDMDEVADTEGQESGVQEILAEGVEDQEGERVVGPQEYVGLWKRTPIGALPVGWEGDE